MTQTDSEQQQITVLIISPSSDLYGAEYSLLAHLDAMDRRFWEPIVMVPHEGLLVKALHQRQVEVIVDPLAAPLINLSWPAWILHTVRLARRLQRCQAKVVELNLWHPVFDLSVWAVAAWIAGAAVIVHVRSNMQFFRRYFWPYERFCLSRADRIICVSQFVKQVLMRCVGGRWFGVDNAGVEVFPDGRSTHGPQPVDQDRRSIREALGTSSTGPLIAFIGALDPIKRPELFIRMAALVHRRREDVRFVLVGGQLSYRTTSEYSDGLRALVQELGVGHVVTFTGYRPDVPRLLSEFDVVVLPSKSEAAGFVLVEAQLAGKPVVAAEVDGIPEMLIHGVTGFLVQGEQPESYAEQVLTLLNDDRLRTMMGERGRQWARDHFDVRLYANRMDELYSQLMRRHRPANRLLRASGWAMTTTALRLGRRWL